MPKKIYLDYNATTPVLPEVTFAVTQAMKEMWGNPSSGHELGKKAKDALETARGQVASIIGAETGEIVFTSGGTESNNLAIIGAALANRARGRHLITTRIEHPSVINPFLHLLEDGWSVDFVEPDAQGIVSPGVVEGLIRQDTVLVSVMLANNETGALQPVKEIGKICRQRGICVHTDAAQAVGKIQVDIRELSVDLLTMAGHKIYAPKGIGALFVRKGLRLANILFGAGQERGLRPGTEPVPLACGIGMACDCLRGKVAQIARDLSGLREELYLLLCKEYRGLKRFVPGEKALPNTLCVSFPGLIGAKVLEMAHEVMASTGAACHDRSVKISHVLSAMGVNESEALGMVRLSLGLMTTKDEIRQAAEAIGSAARALEMEKNQRGVHRS